MVQTLVHTLVPFLAAQIDTHPTLALDVLNDVLTLAQSPIVADTALQSFIARTLLTHRASDRAAVARRAIQGLAQLAALSAPETWADMTEHGLAGLAPPFHDEASSVHLLQAFARKTPERLHGQVALRVEQLYGALNRAEARDDTEEFRESCLLTLQAMVASAPNAPTRLLMAQVAQSQLSYDPNATDDMDDFSDDDAIDVSDDDDLAWRVRRAACRLLADLYSAPNAQDLQAAAPAIAVALCDRLRDREEAVRVDALAAMRCVWRTCHVPLDGVVEALGSWRGAAAQAAALDALSDLVERRAIGEHEGPALLRMVLQALGGEPGSSDYQAALVLVGHLLRQAPAMALEAAEPLANALARAILSAPHRVSLEALHTCERYLAHSSALAPEPAGTLLDAVLARCAHADADASIHDAALVAIDTALCAMGAHAGARLEPSLAMVHARLSHETTRTRCLQIVCDWAECASLQSLAPVQAFAHACLAPLADLAQRPATAVDALQALHAVARLIGHDALATLRRVVALGAPPPDAPALAPALSLAELVVQSDPGGARDVAEAYLPPLLSHLARVPPLAMPALCRLVAALASAEESLAPALVTAVERAWEAQSHEPGAPGAMAYAQCLCAAAASSAALPLVLTRIEALLAGSTLAQTLGYTTLGLLGQQGTLVGWPPALAVYERAASSTAPGQAMAMGGMLLSDEACRAPVVQALAAGDAGALRALREALKLASESQVRALAPVVWPSLLGEALCVAAPDATAECVARLVQEDATLFSELVQRMSAPDAPGRAMALSAVRVIVPLDREHDVDAALIASQPAILQRLSDEDVSVRHAAVMALRAGLQSRPALVLGALPPFLPSLYDLTRVRPELQRQVRMGPFTVVQDDGLDLRKNALETLRVLLDTPLAPSVAPDVVACVVRALQDDDSVKLLACILLVSVADAADGAVRAQLADLAPPLQALLSRKVRDNATKQEMEKVSELTHAAQRVVARLVQLDPASPALAELRAAAAP